MTMFFIYSEHHKHTIRTKQTQTRERFSLCALKNSCSFACVIRNIFYKFTLSSLNSLNLDFVTIVILLDSNREGTFKLWKILTSLYIVHEIMIQEETKKISKRQLFMSTAHIQTGSHMICKSPSQSWYLSKRHQEAQKQSLVERNWTHKIRTIYIQEST